MSTALKIFRGILTGFIVFIFVTAGVMKLSDKFSSAKAHAQMKSDFVRYAKVHPAVVYGYGIDPEKYMKQIGLAELAAATFLLIGPRFLKLLSSLLLSSIMIGAMYTFYMLKEPYEMIAAPTIVLLLLFIKLHFLLIGNIRPQQKAKTE